MPKPKQIHQLRLAFPQPTRPEQLSFCYTSLGEPFHLIFNGFVQGYERQGIFNREDVFNFLGQDRDFSGTKIKLLSQRYFLFAQNPICVVCGLEGLYFAKERSVKKVREQIPGTGRHVIKHLKTDRLSWHLNMYAIKELPNGSLREVLMTKDHILPRSKGGKDIMSNYQTMCSDCNRRKGDTYVPALTQSLEVCS